MLQNIKGDFNGSFGSDGVSISDFEAHIQNYFGLSIHLHFFFLAIMSAIMITLPICCMVREAKNGGAKTSKIMFLYILTPALVLTCLSSIHLYFCLIVLYGNTLQLKIRLALYGGLALMYLLNAFLYVRRQDGKTIHPALLSFMVLGTVVLILSIIMLSLGLIFNEGYVI
mgnify:CR=1 FL=1